MAMRVYYIAVYDNKPDSGVTKKLIAQTKALNSLGVETILLLLSHPNAKKFEEKSVVFEDFPSPPYHSLSAKLGAFFSISKYYKKIFKKYGRGERNTVFYLRNYYPFPSFCRLIVSARRKWAIIVDVVSNNIQESEIRRSNYFYKLFLKYYGSKIANNVSAITGVTDEIVRLNFPSMNKKIPVLSIGNGFDVESVPLTPIKVKEDSITFIHVAHISRWHGLDRLIKGFKNYLEEEPKSVRKKIIFNIVGEGPALQECVDLINKLDLSKYFILHGNKGGRELDDLFEESDIAIGNLATHRKNITITSPLKSKEYCSRGIPFFYSCLDLDFMDFPFVRQIEASEAPLDFGEIMSFWENVKCYPNYNLKMRSYAEENLTWKGKMKPFKTLIYKMEDEG